jgi:molybdopterin molybdotransferase
MWNSTKPSPSRRAWGRVSRSGIISSPRQNSFVMVDAPQRTQRSGPIQLRQAIDGVRPQLSPVFEKEIVPLSLAHGRVLAGNLLAGVDLPPSDSSAVDGFAVKTSDLAAGQVVTLRLVGEAAAGHPFNGVLEHGQAIRILTGAPLPSGADAVVMQETALVDYGSVVIRVDAAPKTHWRQRGEDIRAGSQALPAGCRLRTQHLALASGLGCNQLTVFRQLRVGLFSTGDEVREPGEELRSGQIWDANRCFLRGLLMGMGCEIHDFGILRDEPRLLEGALAAAARDVDLLLTTGGMSVGSEDYIRTIIGRRGSLDVWPIAIKPGKPVGLGDIDHCPILALPGIPIAAVVAFVAFGREVIDILARALEEPLASVLLPAGFEFKKDKGLRQYLLATTTAAPGSTSIVIPVPKQRPAMISAMMAATGFVVLPDDCENVQHGDIVEFVPLAPLFR